MPPATPSTIRRLGSLDMAARVYPACLTGSPPRAGRQRNRRHGNAHAHHRLAARGAPAREAAHPRTGGRSPTRSCSRCSSRPAPAGPPPSMSRARRWSRRRGCVGTPRPGPRSSLHPFGDRARPLGAAQGRAGARHPLLRRADSPYRRIHQPRTHQPLPVRPAALPAARGVRVPVPRQPAPDHLLRRDVPGHHPRRERAPARGRQARAGAQRGGADRGAQPPPRASPSRASRTTRSPTSCATPWPWWT